MLQAALYLKLSPGVRYGQEGAGGVISWMMGKGFGQRYVPLTMVAVVLLHEKFDLIP